MLLRLLQLQNGGRSAVDADVERGSTRLAFEPKGSRRGLLEGGQDF